MTRSADLWDKSLWYATAEEPDPGSDAPADAKVLVVGGGFTGLSTALHGVTIGRMAFYFRSFFDRDKLPPQNLSGLPPVGMIGG